MKPVQLIGLDFGTTTSSAVCASAALSRNAVTGRMDLTRVRERYRSEMVFTPFQDNRLNEEKARDHLDAWLAAGDVRAEDIFGGGALLTGLAAQAENAKTLIDLIRGRLGNALIASALDPCLESWLAFMGSCGGLSRALPDAWIINLDIGGGTTNLALGRNGEVLRTGCLFVGARHIEVRPGTYIIEKLSPYARALFDYLDIAKGPGDTLTGSEVAAVVDFYLRLLQAAVNGHCEVFAETVARRHEQVAFALPAGAGDPMVTLSGGVGELVYSYLQGKPFPPTTYFGDLGIDLARRLLQADEWAEHFRRYQPSAGGRATVFGLLRHSTQISGSTLFLPHPEDLPLGDLPILGSIAENILASDLRALLDLVRRSPRGGCLRLSLPEPGPQRVRALGNQIALTLRDLPFPAHLPLVLFVPQNLGKVFGHYISLWGHLPLHLIVIDEICVRNAQYASLGAMRDLVVPVSVYGLNPQGESP